MIPEFGHFALILAMALAILQAAIPMLGVFSNRRALMQFARPLATGQFAFVTFSFVALALSFLADDFSVQYVANHSNSLLPVQYKLSAVWGGHEGSLLLWLLLLGGWTVAVAAFSQNIPTDFIARVISVMALISVGFILFILFTSNPFLRYLPDTPADGADLNPLLQDVGLIMHPPLLYMGYVGFSVAFAFAIAALWAGKLDAVWAKWSRPWTTIAWAFLTLGIALGSWWAYYELGWGGWWFWDPVENASLMPWLVGTALVHSLAVTEKRGLFKGWTVLLAIVAFSLSLLGTFLVRSGVLTSVHAFASDPGRGVFILALLAITVLGALLLYAVRVPSVRSHSRHDFLSRETFFLLNNLVFMVAMTAVFLGTLYPLFADIFDWRKLSIGAPYFNATFVPLVVIISLLLGLGQLSSWKKSDVNKVFRSGGAIFGASIGIAGVIVFFSAGEGFPLYVLIGLTLAFFVVIAMLVDLVGRLKHRKNKRTALLRLPRAYVGMWLAHVGFAITIVGATMVSNFSVQRDVRISAGDNVEVGGLSFSLTRFEAVRGPNYSGTRAHIDIHRAEGGSYVTRLHPEKRRYFSSQNVMTEAGIDPGLTRDLFVSLGEPLEGASWSMRIQIKPFVRWLWLGALIMAIGGVIAITDRRYRNVKAKQSAGAAQHISTQHI